MRLYDVTSSMMIGALPVTFGTVVRNYSTVGC